MLSVLSTATGNVEFGDLIIGNKKVGAYAHFNQISFSASSISFTRFLFSTRF